MRRALDVIRIGWHVNEGRIPLYNFVPRRGARYQENITWVVPEKKPLYHPSRTGDLQQFPEIKKDSIFVAFRECKELENADDKVKKIFSLGYQMPKATLEAYENELIEKVKRNSWDSSSIEVRIAKLTARIRYYQKLVMERPKKLPQLRTLVKELVEKRKKKLKYLRLQDYKKFEWLLEKLDLEFRPAVPVKEQSLKRNICLVRLAKLRVEQAKEEKLAKLREKLDQQKIPFLEKKIAKLREIKEKEEKYKLPATVLEEDIQKCIRKIEEVKFEIQERAKRGYKRKIHPYLLEAYDEDLLWEKEKAGELIREKQELEKENNTAQTNVS